MDAARPRTSAVRPGGRTLSLSLLCDPARQWSAFSGHHVDPTVISSLPLEVIKTIVQAILEPDGSLSVPHALPFHWMLISKQARNSQRGRLQCLQKTIERLEPESCSTVPKKPIVTESTSTPPATNRRVVDRDCPRKPMRRKRRRGSRTACSRPTHPGP